MSSSFYYILSQSKDNFMAYKEIHNILNFTSNSNNFNFLESEIYSYSLRSENSTKLAKLIEDHTKKYSLFFPPECLYTFYDSLYREGLFWIIDEIINENNIHSVEALAIVMVCIYNNQHDLITNLIYKGFDINQTIIKPKHRAYSDLDNEDSLLYFATFREDIDLIKFLINHGAYISHNNYAILTHSYILKNRELFDYLIELVEQTNGLAHIPYYYLIKMYHKYYGDNLYNIRKLLDKMNQINKKLDINDPELQNILLIAKSEEFLLLLIDYGLDLQQSSQDLFYESLKSYYDILFEYFLKIGFKPSEKMIVDIIKDSKASKFLLLLKYHIDITVTEQATNKYNDLLISLENHGLNRNILLNIFLNNFLP